ncbi:MAG TPA: S8 family serine peptidase, partial [Tahibacter sp.]|nr:S8 family serine peptidase [Tahibacter sp.]
MHKPLCLALAVALFGHAPFAAADNTRLRFNHVDVDPVANPAERAGFHPTTQAGEGLMFVQFDATIKTAWRDALEARGLRVLQYYPGEAYLVWGRVADVAKTASVPHVRWQGGLLAQDKINRDLVARTGRIRNVDVHFYNNDDVKSTLATLEELGATLVSHAPAQPDRAFYDAWIEIDAERLADIALLPQVVALAYAHPNVEYDDEMSAQIVAGNYTAANVPQPGYLSWLGDFGFSGNGVVWGITDTGVDLGHPDLFTQIVGGFSFPGCASPGGDDEAGGGHGTHVAGIVVGRGVGDSGGTAVDEDDANGFLYGLGVAPAASIYAVCSGNASWPPAGGWQALSKANLDGGALGMNASWHSGEGTAHGYQASERTFDLMIRDGDFDTPGNQPFMVVFSAGNSGAGPTTLTAPKEAKNPITTASTRNFRAGAIDAVSTFSSRGPAVDGRVLPTIAAPGESIVSTRRRAGAAQCGGALAGTGGYYSSCSGTSMAAPHASGAVATLAQWWRGYHGGADPSPAMAKALLVNGAVDIAA